MAPHRIVQYWRFEGLNRGRKKSLFLSAGCDADKHKETHPYGFLPMLEPNYQYADTEYKRQVVKAEIDKANEARAAYNNSLQNLIDNKPTGISSAAKKRLMNAINFFYILSKPKEYEYELKLGAKVGQMRKGFFRLNFITLTLCADQDEKTNDKYVKSEMLNYFLERLRRNHGMNTYVWRAERQENGRIHFHIATNVYVHWKLVRKYWNDIQARCGFIDRYIVNGGNNDPNSTDVHAIHTVRKIVQYISKYMTKDGKPGAKPIEGRQWFLSSNLSDIEPISGVFDGDLREELERFADEKKRNWIEHPYAYVVYADVFTADLTKYPYLTTLREKFFLENQGKIS